MGLEQGLFSNTAVVFYYTGEVTCYSKDSTLQITSVVLVWQVGQVREVEVRAARGEGALDAHHVAEQQRMQLQQEGQERLQHLRDQEQQV